MKTWCCQVERLDTPEVQIMCTYNCLPGSYSSPFPCQLFQEGVLVCFKFIFIYLFILYAGGGGVHIWQHTCEVNGHLAGVSSLLPLSRSEGLNLCGQAGDRC